MKDISWKNKQVQQLVDAFVYIDSSIEAEAFLRDLLTADEIMEFSRRLEAARLLSNKTAYNYITDKTGLSSTTIARIAKWLRGPIGGYRTVLGKLSATMHHHNPISKLGKGLSLTRT